MRPTFAQGSLLLSIPLINNSIKQGDIVLANLFLFDGEKATKIQIIKRVKEIKKGEGGVIYLFLTGDNKEVSWEGMVSIKDITGKAYPLTKNGWQTALLLLFLILLVVHKRKRWV